MLISGNCLAQSPQFQQEIHPFSVSFYGVEPQAGFVASGQYYHHDFGDIDEDGDNDLVIFTGQGRIAYFDNIGTTNNPLMQLMTNQLVVLVSSEDIYQSPCLCDIDNDNDLDLFVGDDGFIMYYKNIGDANNLEFILEDTAFGDIEIYEKPVPKFVDIDRDGDFDLFIGIGQTSWDGRIYFYLNEGTPELSEMIFQTNYFNTIDVGGDASPEFYDIDNDNDYDLLIGCYDGKVWYYENIGDSVNYDFEYVTNTYFNIDVGNMSVPRFCDIDADGDFDLFVANESAGYTNNIEGDIAFYENVGDSINPQFEFATANYLFCDMGSTSSPLVLDIDDDSLNEILVGILGGQFVLLDNSGTQSEPEFYFADTSYFNLTFPYGPAVTFGDLDNDNDLDLIVSEGSFWSYLDLYRNIGTIGAPQYEFWEEIASSWDYTFYTPDLVDIDGDNDLDLFFGYHYNLLQYCENVGDVNAPHFRLIDDNYLNQTPYSGELNPRFGDLDHDNDYDLIIGRYTWDYFGYQGNIIEYWENIGDPQNASFTPADTIYEESPSSSNMSLRPYLSDIDADGDLDIICGEQGGALLFFRNLENPFQAQLTITVQDNDIILTWGNIADAVEYHIFYQDIPYFTPSSIPQAIVLPPDTVWMDYNVILEMQRFYRMITITP